MAIMWKICVLKFMPSDAVDTLRYHSVSECEREHSVNQLHSTLQSLLANGSSDAVHVLVFRDLGESRLGFAILVLVR